MTTVVSVVKKYTWERGDIYTLEKASEEMTFKLRPGKTAMGYSIPGRGNSMC